VVFDTKVMVALWLPELREIQNTLRRALLWIGLRLNTDGVGSSFMIPWVARRFCQNRWKIWYLAVRSMWLYQGICGIFLQSTRMAAAAHWRHVWLVL
jgi:hypothetical protein